MLNFLMKSAFDTLFKPLSCLQATTHNVIVAIVNQNVQKPVLSIFESNFVDPINFKTSSITTALDNHIIFNNLYVYQVFLKLQKFIVRYYSEQCSLTRTVANRFN